MPRFCKPKILVSPHEITNTHTPQYPYFKQIKHCLDKHMFHLNHGIKHQAACQCCVAVYRPLVHAAIQIQAHNKKAIFAGKYGFLNECDLNAHLTAAQYNPFLVGQAFQAHRAAHMDFVGRDADFRTQAVFKTIGKTRRRIHHHTG